MIKINLLPPESRKKLKKAAPSKKKTAGPSFKLDFKFNPLVVFPSAAVILVILLIGASYVWLGQKDRQLKARRDSMQVELNKLNQVITRIDTLKKHTKQVRDRMEVILKVDRNRYLWPRILDEISAALPSYTWLESISETSPFPELRLRVEGTTMSNLLLSRILRNLERSSMLSEVRLVSSAERIYGGIDTKYFIIECACELNEPSEAQAAASAQTASAQKAK